jgi:hypothetical protein
MVNPVRLPPQERDSVCSQCHLSGSARIEKAGKRIAAFRPGENLNEYVAYFVPVSTEGGEVRATSHMEKLEASACKKAAGDKLWCGTCHSPHRKIEASTACISCHSAVDCTRGRDCAGCHMPKKVAVDGGHGVLTDHSIPRSRIRKDSKTMWRLTTFRGFTATDRELGLAYAETNRPDESRKLLQKGAPDPAVLIRMGEWEAALRADKNSVVAMVNLGVMRANAGDFASAESLWRESLARNPGLVEAATNLFRLLEAAGRTREAQEVLSQIREFEPQFVPPRERIP